MKREITVKYNDKKLLNAVKKFKLGDKEAFDTIYKLTYKKVYFFSLSITKDSELTKDIVQEIYVNVFKYIGSLKDEKFFIAWLNQITYNTSKKELGKLSKKTLNITDEELHTKLIDGDNPILKCIEDENTKELIKCIMNLKEKYRTVLILKYFNNYKVKDIAKLINCPEGTVKSRLNTAKELLKDSLAKKYNKIFMGIGFGLMVSSALTKTAEASIIRMNPGNAKNSLFIENIEKLKSLLTSKMKAMGLGISIISTSAYIVSDISKEYIEKKVIVEYDSAFTNKNMKVNIKIDNLEKKDTVRVLSSSNEEIIIEKVNERLFVADIAYNGDYNLMINDEVLSTISIENIDKEAPIVKSNSNNGEVLELFLSDNLSGINYDKLKSTLEGDTKINPINIDQENNKISLELTKGTRYLEIFDNAGNTSLYKIEIE